MTKLAWPLGLSIGENTILDIMNDKKKSFLLSLPKSHSKMFQEAARLQGGNPLSMKAVTIRKRNYLWTKSKGFTKTY